ncbi:MAG: molybdenum cofactor guanylyltransferase [Nitrospirae bacterium]|nr:molybdenum cofactor guanylyltransferase [Nitrospirota bacterium]
MSGCGEITAAVILAGGVNRRFGAPKSFIDIEGTPIIKRSLSLLKELFDEVFISTNDPEQYFHLADCAGVPLIGDVFSSLGPMSGIYSALINSRGPGIFAVACDMPFLRQDVIRFICKEHLRYSRECGPCDATVPVFNNEPQPLSAVYSRTLLPHLENALINCKTAMTPFLRGVKTFFIDEADLRVIDPEGRSFTNINTAGDYEAIRKQVNSER